MFRIELEDLHNLLTDAEETAPGGYVLEDVPIEVTFIRAGGHVHPVILTNRPITVAQLAHGACIHNAFTNTIDPDPEYDDANGSPAKYSPDWWLNLAEAVTVTGNEVTANGTIMLTKISLDGIDLPEDGRDVWVAFDNAGRAVESSTSREPDSDTITWNRVPRDEADRLMTETWGAE